MIFNCDALGKSIEVITFSIPISCLDGIILCFICITGSNIHQGVSQEESKDDNGGS